MLVQSNSALLFAIFFVLIILAQPSTVDNGKRTQYLNNPVKHGKLITSLCLIYPYRTSNFITVITRQPSTVSAFPGSKVTFGLEMARGISVFGKPVMTVPQYEISLTPGVSPRVFAEGTSDIILPVFVGQTWAINLTQQVTGDSLVWLWLKNDKPMTWSDNGLIYMAKGDLQLTASSDDIGAVYQLNVTNSAGTALSRQIKLVAPPPPKFTANLPKTVTSFPDEELEISVQFEDDGYTRFQWTLNGNKIFRETAPTIKLTVHRGLSGAELSVTATNQSGETRQTTTLRVLWPKWAIVLITLCCAVTVAAILYALKHKGYLKRPTCLGRRSVEYSLQAQEAQIEFEDDIELSLDDHDN